jgi:hypothetical protein
LLRNGSFLQRGSMSPTPGGYRLAFLGIDGTGWSAGDHISLQVMASASTADLFLDFIELRPVEAPAVAPGAASGAQDTEARASIGQILDILRARGLMA